MKLVPLDRIIRIYFGLVFLYPLQPVDPVDLLDYQLLPIPPTDCTIKAKLAIIQENEHFNEDFASLMPSLFLTLNL